VNGAKRYRLDTVGRIVAVQGGQAERYGGFLPPAIQILPQG
jgi:hypothetical protein